MRSSSSRTRRPPPTRRLVGLRLRELVALPAAARDLREARGVGARLGGRRGRAAERRDGCHRGGPARLRLSRRRTLSILAPVALMAGSALVGLSLLHGLA